MAGPVSWNFTIDDASPMLTYLPYADGHGLTKGWQTWYTGSGYNTQSGESASGDSFHQTSLDGAQVSLSFYGSGIALYGTTNASYEVTLDNNIVDKSMTVQGVFFSQSGLEEGVHNVKLTAQPSNNDQVLSFRQAIVTSTVNSSSSTSQTLTIDNQNTTAITYTGNWVPDKVVSGVPSSSLSTPFHSTSELGASALFSFFGRTVAVYGSTTFGHGQYVVTLDGNERVLNGSSDWLIGNLLLFYEDGLDETVPHSLNITNLGDNEAFSLNKIDVLQFASASSTSNSSNNLSVGAIVGPTLAALTVLSILSLYLWARHRDRHKRKATGRSMFSSSILIPRRWRRGDGRLTPFVVTLNRPRSAQSFTSSDASAYFSGRGYADNTKPTRHSPTASSNFEAFSAMSSPDSICATHAFTATTIYPSDSASQHPASRIVYPPRALSTSRERDTRLSGHDMSGQDQAALVDRILEMVVQRIDTRPLSGREQNSVRNVTNDSLSRLPPYPEDV